MVDFQSSDVDGHVDNDLLILCFMVSMFIHYPVHCLAYCPINVLRLHFVLCNWTLHINHCKYYFVHGCILQTENTMFYLFFMLYN